MPELVKVKICGVTSLDDALLAADAGADGLGFIFYDKSPRYVAPSRAAEIIRRLPPFVQAVGLFVNAGKDFIESTVARCGIDVIQLHGDESPQFCASMGRRVIKSFSIRDMSSLDPVAGYRVSACVLDAYSPHAYGGTGLTFNWEIARAARDLTTVILAGGLTPENVADAVREASPYGVDVSSGVEKSPGIKDPAKVREFVRRAKGLR